MKIYLCGQKFFGAKVFTLIRRLGHEVVGVSSPAANTRGDGPDKLAAAAKLHEVPWLESGKLNAHTLPDDVDLIVAAHSHDFIGRKTRMRARLGAIGYHPSLLPRHRGRDAVRWALHMGDPITGGSIYWLNDVMDGGPLAAQDWVWIRPGDTAEKLWRHDLFPLGLRLFEHVLRMVDAGTVVRIPQDEAVSTFEPAFDPPRKFRPDLEALPMPGAQQDVRIVTSVESLREVTAGA